MSGANRVARRTARPGRPARFTGTVFDAVADGLGRLRDRVSDYHHAITAVTENATAERLAALGEASTSSISTAAGASSAVELVLNRLGLPADAKFDRCRRVERRVCCTGAGRDLPCCSSMNRRTTLT